MTDEKNEFLNITDYERIIKKLDKDDQPMVVINDSEILVKKKIPKYHSTLRSRIVEIPKNI